jgi:DnaJ homologue, subfamily C, member 28, conserved domain
MSDFERIAEEKIRDALKNGEFDNLPGSGKPLRLEDDSAVAPDLRMAYRLLKNAHCLPPELELRKEILRLKDLLQGVAESSERARKVREINLLITKLNLLRQKPLSMETRQMVISRLSVPNDSPASAKPGSNTPDAKS